MRSRIGKNLEKSTDNGSLIVTDVNDEAYYYAPTNPNEILILDATTNLPIWSEDIVINGTLELTRENDGEAHRLLSQDAGGLVSARENFQIYKNICSVSGTPGLSLGTGAGSGATHTISGTNDSGTITLDTGVSPLSGGGSLVFTVTLNTLTYPNSCAVCLFPINANAAAAVTNIVASGSTNAWSVASLSPLSGTSTYQWNYIVKGH